MSSSSTNTASSTFTIANARNVTSRVKTDLKLLQREYGSPSDEKIEDFGEEAAQLLNKKYLGTVKFGFRRDGDWVVALSYTANNDGTLGADERAGQISRGVDISGASFYSYLSYSAKWDEQTYDAQVAFKTTLPVQRTGATEPGSGNGYWEETKSYSSNGRGVTRKSLKPL